MISIANLSKNYGKKTLFSDCSLTINPGEKIGLVGPNGSGKSTLFSLILGEIEPSSGRVQVRKNTRIGYLAQEPSFSSAHTVLTEMTEGEDTILALKKEKEKLEGDNKAGSARYGDILHELEILGYFELEHKAKRILMGLGFKEQDFDRPIKDLSGGWQIRTLLARLLAFRYDIMLLDEPTNYLDLNAAIWFKDYLHDCDSTFIMISHDKDFLDEVTNYTLILEGGNIFKVKGNYEHYLKIREDKCKHLVKQYTEQEKKRQQLQKFIYRFHGQPNKASQVRAKRREMERMEEIIVPADIRDSIRKFHFPKTGRSGYRLMELKKISKAYGDIQVYKDFDFEITQGEKAVLAGENGAGKSTLLKIIAGVIPIDAGIRKLGHNVDIGYFSQTRMDILSEHNTVLQEAYTAAPADMRAETVRTILGVFLFQGDDVEKMVSILSGGEKSRLCLAKLLLNPPNFLLLDEPTTHLDVDAVEALIAALTEYEGTLIMISHDIHFVRSLANMVYHVDQGRVRKFPGEFDYYWEKKSRGELDSAPVAKHKAKKETEQKTKPEEFTEEEKRDHNAKRAATVKNLRKKLDRLNSDLYAKERVISNPRHGAKVITEYREIAQAIKKKIEEIEKKIFRAKQEFI